MEREEMDSSTESRCFSVCVRVCARLFVQICVSDGLP